MSIFSWHLNNTEDGDDMTVWGYARVSTKDQDLSIQIDELTKAGCQNIRSEKITGTSLDERQELKTLLEFMNTGDTLVITRFDRLARSLKDLLKITTQLKEMAVELKVLNQSFDITTNEGKLFMSMLGAFAEFETNIRRERQLEGVAKAKADGKYKGTKPRHDRDWILRLKDEGLSHSAIAKRVGCAPKTVQRAVNEKLSSGSQEGAGG